MNKHPAPDNRLAQLLAAIQASQHYRSLCQETIRAVGAQELAKRASLKEAIKATKAKLHQIGGAYIRGDDYARWLDLLRQAARSADNAAFQSACRQIMGYHASTRERLPILDEFYRTIFADLPPVRSVLDLGCGLNPLAFGWMSLAEGATFYACDLYTDLAAFLNDFFALAPLQGHAETCDLLQSPPTQQADVALLLKTLPVLEQRDPTASLRLLEQINAPHLVVSYPLASLGGRRKGMAANYGARFERMVAGKGWGVRRFEFKTELVFRIKK